MTYWISDKHDSEENLRVEYTIKRILPKAIYYFDEEDGYWNIGLTNEKDQLFEVRVTSIYLSDLNDQELETLIKNIGYDICGKMTIWRG